MTRMIRNLAISMTLGAGIVAPTVLPSAAALAQHAAQPKEGASIIVEGTVREVFRSPRQTQIDYVVLIDVARSEYGRARPILGAFKLRHPETRSTSMSSRRLTGSAARGTTPSRPSAARFGLTSTLGLQEAGKERSPTGSTRPTSSREDGARTIRSRRPDQPLLRLPRRPDPRPLPPPADRSFRSWACGPSRSTSAAAWCSRRSTCSRMAPPARRGSSRATRSSASTAASSPISISLPRPSSRGARSPHWSYWTTAAASRHRSRWTSAD